MNQTTKNRLATLEQRVHAGKDKPPLCFRVLKDEEHTPDKTWACCVVNGERIFMGRTEDYPHFVARCKNAD